MSCNVWNFVFLRWLISLLIYVHSKRRLHTTCCYFKNDQTFSSGLSHLCGDIAMKIIHFLSHERSPNTEYFHMHRLYTNHLSFLLVTTSNWYLAERGSLAASRSSWPPSLLKFKRKIETVVRCIELYSAMLIHQTQKQVLQIWNAFATSLCHNYLNRL